VPRATRDRQLIVTERSVPCTARRFASRSGTKPWTAWSSPRVTDRGEWGGWLVGRSGEAGRGPDGRRLGNLRLGNLRAALGFLQRPAAQGRGRVSNLVGSASHARGGIA
jgi:hypothetical protein